MAFEVGVKESTTYVSTQFLIGLMSNPALVRNVALVGHLQHGKSVFMDMLVEQTHRMSTFNAKNEKHMKYTDTRVNEQEREISIKAVPMSLVLEDSRSKSYLCNVIDTPRHVNFSDEITASLRLVCAVLIVDAAEGVMVKTEKTFVQFSLEPLYKIYSQVIGEHKKSVETTLAELGVTLSNSEYKLNDRPLLRLTCSSAFRSSSGFTDMLVKHIPSPKEAAARKVDHIYTGSIDSPIYESMVDCDPSEPLMVNVTKLYPKSDTSVFGRVYIGRLQTGQSVRVLGEGYSLGVIKFKRMRDLIGVQDVSKKNFKLKGENVEDKLE